MGQITVIGSLNMDMTVNTPRMPGIGETILGSGFQTVPGGKGANQAVAIARLGGTVSMAGCIGDDSFGQALIQNLAANGVDTSGIDRVPGSPTGVAVITVCGGDNTIIVDPGANGQMQPDRVDALESLISESEMLVLQLEIPLEGAKRAMELAKKHRVKVLLNPAPAVPLKKEILELADIITPNESECEILTGMPIRSVGDAEKAAMELKRLGANTVIVTLGENGAILLDQRKFLHVPARKVQAVDTTAAGDSFTGALAYAVTKGMPLEESVHFAGIAASITVTRRGAQASMPYPADLESIR